MSFGDRKPPDLPLCHAGCVAKPEKRAPNRLKTVQTIDLMTLRKSERNSDWRNVKSAKSLVGEPMPLPSTNPVRGLHPPPVPTCLKFSRPIPIHWTNRRPRPSHPHDPSRTLRAHQGCQRACGAHETRAWGPRRRFQGPSTPIPRTRVVTEGIPNPFFRSLLAGLCTTWSEEGWGGCGRTQAV